MASQEALQQLFNAMETSRTVSYFSLAAVVVAAYDLILRWSWEVEHIWSARLSVVKVLYFIARYYGLTFLIYNFAVVATINPSPKVPCDAFTWVTSIAGPVVFTTTVNTILSLRLYALYGQTRKLLVFLPMVVFVEFVMELYCSIAAARKTIRIDPPLGLPWTGCLFIPPSSVREALLAWITCLTASWIFFLLMVYKFGTMVRWRKRVPSSISGTSTALLTIFIRDGTLYFFLIFCAVLICTVFINVTSLKPYYQIPFAWMITIYLLAGSSLILNLRGAAKTPNRTLSFTAADSTAVPGIKAARRGTHAPPMTTTEYEMQIYGDRDDDETLGR